MSIRCRGLEKQGHITKILAPLQVKNMAANAESRLADSHGGVIEVILDDEEMVVWIGRRLTTTRYLGGKLSIGTSK